MLGSPWTGALQAREEVFKNSKSTPPCGEVNATRCWAPSVNRTAWSAHLLSSEDVADRTECLGVSGSSSGADTQVRSSSRHSIPLPRHAVPSNGGGRCRATCFDMFLLKCVCDGDPRVQEASQTHRIGFHQEQHLGAPATHIGSNSVWCHSAPNRRLFAAGCEEPRVDEFEARLSVVSTTSQVRLQLCSGNSHSNLNAFQGTARGPHCKTPRKTYPTFSW